MASADWDANGELFYINTVIGHLWHAVPGAHFTRMYGEDFNAHLYALMPQTADRTNRPTRAIVRDDLIIEIARRSSNAAELSLSASLSRTRQALASAKRRTLPSSCSGLLTGYLLQNGAPGAASPASHVSQWISP